MKNRFWSGMRLSIVSCTYYVGLWNNTEEKSFFLEEQIRLASPKKIGACPTAFNKEEPYSYFVLLGVYQPFRFCKSSPLNKRNTITLQHFL